MKICSSPARLAVFNLALAAAFPALAQSQLPPIVVTAARIAQPLTDVVADVSIIDREQIEASSGRTLSELLVREAGVQMSANGGLGKSSRLYLRGTNAGHTLLLIDGVRYGSATLGQANWDNIPLEMIERIEVLKGPAAALYGSEAMGGVVQVFTRQGRQGFHPHASVTLGSNSHRKVAAGVAGGDDEVSYALGASSLTEKGFSATNSRIGSSYNADRDGFDQESVSGSLAWRLAPGWRLTAHALQASGDNRSDNGSSNFDVRTETSTQVLGAGLEHQWLEGVRTTLKLSRGTDQSIYYSSADPRKTTRYDTERTQTTLQHQWDSAIGTWMLGAESVRESVSSTTAYQMTDRRTESVFAGLTGQKQGHLWQLNLRHDDNSQFGSADTGYLGYGYQFTPEWSLHGGYGTTFRAPSFNNLYSPDPKNYPGNPLLQPEKGSSKELALAYKSGVGPIKLIRFDNQIDGLIIWPNASTAAVNVDNASIAGWSLGYEGGAGLWSWQSQFDWLDAKDEKWGLKLPQRASKQVNASLRREVADWKLGVHWFAAAKRFNGLDTKNGVNTKPLAGYGTLDLSAEHALDQDWRIQFRLNNLTDKTYETVYGYNQPGRSAYVTLRWQGR